MPKTIAKYTIVRKVSHQAKPSLPITTFSKISNGHCWVRDRNQVADFFNELALNTNVQDILNLV